MSTQRLTGRKVANVPVVRADGSKAVVTLTWEQYDVLPAKTAKRKNGKGS